MPGPVEVTCSGLRRPKLLAQACSGRGPYLLSLNLQRILHVEILFWMHMNCKYLFLPYLFLWVSLVEEIILTLIYLVFLLSWGQDFLYISLL